MFKIGVIGCGWIAKKVYLPLLNSMDNVCLFAAFDTDERSITSLKEKYEIPVICKNFKEFIELPLDAVIIATPNYTHSYYANCSLECGKHVLCEKPVAFSKSKLQETVSIANKNKRIFFPALVNRFRKDVQYFKEKSCEIGKITDIDVCWIRKSGIPKLGSWITNEGYSGGGALIDIGTHIIDIGLMFVDNLQVEKVEASFGVIDNIEKHRSSWNDMKTSISLPINVETSSAGKIFFKDVIMNYDVSWCSNVDEDITCIKLYGENGTAVLKTLFGFSKDYIRDTIEISIIKNNTIRDSIFLSMENTFAQDAFKALLNAFIDCTEGKDNSILKMNDAFYVVDIIEKLYSKQGEEIYVYSV